MKSRKAGLSNAKITCWYIHLSPAPCVPGLAALDHVTMPFAVKGTMLGWTELFHHSLRQSWALQAKHPPVRMKRKRNLRTKSTSRISDTEKLHLQQFSTRFKRHISKTAVTGSFISVELEFKIWKKILIRMAHCYLQKSISARFRDQAKLIHTNKPTWREGGDQRNFLTRILLVGQ